MSEGMAVRAEEPSGMAQATAHSNSTSTQTTALFISTSEYELRCELPSPSPRSGVIQWLEFHTGLEPRLQYEECGQGASNHVPWRVLRIFFLRDFLLLSRLA